MRCEDTRCEETRCEDARCEEVRCEEMKCEEVNCVAAASHLSHTPRGALPGVPRGSHGEKCSLSEQKGGNEHQKGPFLYEIGQIGTKSKKFRSFITEKAIFGGQTDRRTDGNISALRAGVPQISVHQNLCTYAH